MADVEGKFMKIILPRGWLPIPSCGLYVMLKYIKNFVGSMEPFYIRIEFYFYVTF